MTWFEQAACRGMDPALFFAERGDWFAVRQAKAVCSTCPVTAECLAECRSVKIVGGRPVPGIWGGTSERERRTQRQSHPYQPAWWIRDPALAEWARALRADGGTQAAIASELGLSRDSIRTWLHRCGDPWPPRNESIAS